MMVAMIRTALARAAAVGLASLLVAGLPVGGGAAVAQTHECHGARCTPPQLVLRGKNNGARDDRLRVLAISQAAGAEVRLFRRQDGEWVEVASGVLNDKGNARFVVDDLNGRRYTKYLARVRETDDTHRMRGAKRVR